MYLHKHHLDNVIICRGGESVTKGHIRRVEIPRDGTSISVFVLYYLMMICVTRLCDFSKFWQNIYIKNCQNGGDGNFYYYYVAALSETKIYTSQIKKGGPLHLFILFK